MSQMQEAAPVAAAYDARTSNQPTRTRTVSITQRVDADGILTLHIPAGAALAHAVLYVTVMIEEPVSDPPPTPEELGWPPGFFEQTAGASPDFPLDADASYAPDERQWLHAQGLLADPRLPEE